MLRMTHMTHMTQPGAGRLSPQRALPDATGRSLDGDGMRVPGGCANEGVAHYFRRASMGEP